MKKYLIYLSLCVIYFSCSPVLNDSDPFQGAPSSVSSSENQGSTISWDKDSDGYLQLMTSEEKNCSKSYIVLIEEEKEVKEIEFAVKKLSGYRNAPYGVFFCSQEGEDESLANAYLFVMMNSGYFSTDKMADGKITTDAKMKERFYIKKGALENRIRISFTEKGYNLYLN